MTLPAVPAPVLEPFILGIQYNTLQPEVPKILRLLRT